MGKFYRTFFLFMVLVLASLNISFFIYNQNLEDYLREGVDMGGPQVIQELDNTVQAPSLFNQDRFNDPRFKNLEYFSMDSSGFDLPDDFLDNNEDLDMDEDDSDSEEIDLPEFEVGNPNPFAPF